MSTATAPTTTATPPSAVDYVRALQPEEKQAVFLALLREALTENGDTGLLPVDDEDGNPFGYYVPPKAAEEIAQHELPKLSAEREKELAERLTRLHTAISMAQALAELTPPAGPLRTPQL